MSGDVPRTPTNRFLLGTRRYRQSLPSWLAMSFLLLTCVVMTAVAPCIAATSDSGSALPLVDDLDWLDFGVTETLGNDGAPDDGLGATLAVDGDTAVAGALYDHIGLPNYQGSAHVFVRDGDHWRIEAKLVVGDDLKTAGFATSVAISGETIVVGAPQRTVDGVLARGAAYVFVRAGGQWIKQARLDPLDPVLQQGFGKRVAISGNTILISSPTNSKIYEFARTGGTWQQRGSFTVHGLACCLGGNLSFDGITLAVGRPSLRSALLFVKQAGGWVQQADLRPDDESGDNWFGHAVVVEGDTLLVGAPWDSTPTQARRGAVYAFHQNAAGEWEFAQRIEAQAGAAEERFGMAVALHGERALVGSSVPYARAYAFSRVAGSWTQKQRLDVSDSGPDGLYGAAVALTADDALIGAPERSHAGNDAQGAVMAYAWNGADWVLRESLQLRSGWQSARAGSAVAASATTVVTGIPGLASEQGAVQVHQRTGEQWVLQATLTARDGMPHDGFGAAVAIDGDTLVVGARAHASEGQFARGAAYVYTRTDGVWALQATLFASDGTGSNLFGHAVAISGDTILVSAYMRRQAYVFVRENGVWREQSKLLPPAPELAVGFGYAVALDGDTALVSASEEIVDGVGGAGAVHVYVRDAETWDEQAMLSAPDGGEYHIFGRSLSLDGNRAAIGAARPNAARDGVLYLFDRDAAGLWHERALMRVSEGGARDSAAAVQLRGSTIVVGTNGDAYLLTRGPDGWRSRRRFAPPPDVIGSDTSFGSAIALASEGSLFLGAAGSDGIAPFGNPDVGRVYFSRVESLFYDGME